MIPATRPVVKIDTTTTGATSPGPECGHSAECKVAGCNWSYGPHVVKAAVEEQARWHRDQHRRAAEVEQ